MRIKESDSVTIVMKMNIEGSRGRERRKNKWVNTITLECAWGMWKISQMEV